jgi:hypothetical protein
MTIAANAYGGATRHCDAPTEKPMFSVRMIGKKYARAYVTVVVLKKIYDGKFLCQYYHVINAYHSEAPNFDISTTAKKLLPIKGLRPRIASILVDALDDELRFALVEEMPGCVSLVGKVNKSPVTNDAHEHRQCSFNDEDPSAKIPDQYVPHK